MAELVGGIGASHAPSISAALSGTNHSAWRPLLDAFDHVRNWVVQRSVDAIVVIYNDHCVEFFLDRCPTFSIGVAESFEIVGHESTLPPAPGHEHLGRHIATEAIEHGIDFTVCHRQGVDDGVVVPLPLIDQGWSVPIVPINVNVVWDPRPSPARCWAMGEAVGAAIRSYPEPLRVAVVGTGGLSHQLVGRDFGTVHPEWDRRFLREMEEAPESLRSYTMSDLEELAGHEGVEVVQWIAMRAALGADCRAVYTCYFPYRMIGYAVVCYEPVHDRVPVAR
jgi:hypothetical protein